MSIMSRKDIIMKAIAILILALVLICALALGGMSNYVDNNVAPAYITK